MKRPEEIGLQRNASTEWAFAAVGLRQEELLGPIFGRSLTRLEEFRLRRKANT